VSAETAEAVSGDVIAASRKVAVIVVCWNNRDLLADCFDSVRKQTLSSDDIVMFAVDNASEDGTCAYLRAEYPEVHVIEVGWNSGFSHANNLGIAAAFDDPTVESIVLLNSDARLAEDWIETVVGFARTRPAGASFQSLTVAAGDHRVIDSHHLYVGHSLHAYQSGTEQLIDRDYPTCRVFGVNAAAALYTRAFLEAQPMPEVLDETMGMYLEDVDLAARALVMGWESWFVAGTRAYHIGSHSSKKRSGGFSLRQTWRNQTVLLLTNFPARLLVRGLAGLIGHEIGAIRHLLATGRPELIKDIAMGRLLGLRLVPYALRRRRMLRSHVVVDPDLIWEFMATGTALT
jgi:GT2 family glycosyltransferase